MKKSILATAVVGTLALTACGKETVYVTQTEAPTTEAPVTLPPVTSTAPAPTRPPASYDNTQTNGQYDQAGFMSAVQVGAPTVYILMPDADILNMGLLICETFDSGATLDEVTQMMVSAMMDSGSMGFMEELAAVQASAMLYLCPEHAWWLDTL